MKDSLIKIGRQLLPLGVAAWLMSFYMPTSGLSNVGDPPPFLMSLRIPLLLNMVLMALFTVIQRGAEIAGKQSRYFQSLNLVACCLAGYLLWNLGTFSHGSSTIPLRLLQAVNLLVMGTVAVGYFNGKPCFEDRKSQKRSFLHIISGTYYLFAGIVAAVLLGANWRFQFEVFGN